MLTVVASLLEQLIDEAGELGVRLTRAGNRFPAETAVELRQALAAIRRAAEALDRSQAPPALDVDAGKPAP